MRDVKVLRCTRKLERFLGIGNDRGCFNQLEESGTNLGLRSCENVIASIDQLMRRDAADRINMNTDGQ